MADFFKILKADALGDPWTPSQPGAKPIQNYWCQVEGQALAVSIGKQVREDGQPALRAGQHIYGNLMYAKSQKGTEYWKFKSEQVPEGVQRPADSPAQAAAQQATGTAPVPNTSQAMPDWFMPVANQIDYIFREMQKLDADAPTPVEQQAALLDVPFVEPEHVSTEIDPETQAKLDEIFGSAKEPEEPDDYPDDIGAKG